MNRIIILPGEFVEKAEILSLIEVAKKQPEIAWSKLRAKIDFAGGNPSRVVELSEILDGILDGGIDQFGLAWVALSRGILLWDRARAAASASDFDWSLRCFRASQEKLGEAIALHNQANACQRMGRFSKVEQGYRDAIALLKVDQNSPVWKRELAIALRRLADFRIQTNTEGKDADCRMLVDGALEIVDNLKSGSASHLQDLAICQYIDARCTEVEGGDGLPKLRTAASSAQSAIKQDRNSLVAQQLSYEIQSVMELSEEQAADFKGSSAVRLQRALTAFAQALALREKDDTWGRTARSTILATKRVANAFEKNRQVDLAAAFFRRYRELSNEWEQSDSDSYLAATTKVTAINEMIRFTKWYPKLGDSLALTREGQTAFSRLATQFPEAQKTQPSDIYEFFKSMPPEELKQLADDAIAVLNQSQTREEAEAAVVKMAPFFLDCTFPRLESAVQEQLKKCMDTAEGKWGTLANVLGFEDALMDSDTDKIEGTANSAPAANDANRKDSFQTSEESMQTVKGEPEAATSE